MKTRVGFVSNSSSSSYIVAVKKTSTPCPHCGRSDPDFLDYLSSKTNDSFSDETSFNAEGEDVVSSYSDSESKIGVIREYLKDGSWRVASISISYHDIATKALFDNLLNSGNLVIIQDIG